MTRILHLDSSARRDGSVTRTLGAEIVARLSDRTAIVTHRDLAGGVPFLDAGFVEATFTPEDKRSDAQRTALATSDVLLAELEAADTIVIATPIYNFGIPAVLKAWIDQVGRVGRSFRYTETGPEGLLTGKRAIVAIASGGTPIGSDIDFASGYLRHVLGFLGIRDVTIVTADTLDDVLPASDSVARAA
jgi:FMN-dependent NADH-azoreductase